MDTIKRVLIIEDEFIIAKDIKQVLKASDYDVTIANNVVKAIRLFDEEDFDCIISDINLNDEIDGIELIHQLFNLKFVPVVFLTAYNDNQFLERAKETIPFAYLLKPFDEKQLLLTIDLAILNFNKNKSVSNPTISKNQLETLTRREKEILISLSTGKTSKEIGSIYHISPLTVEKHKKNIKKKLNMSTVGELINFVFQSNLYSL
ncbi:DNA-binding response regulator, NarL/FixJ family, contains REC and HTH domains [Pustulibacterium marinum]|uniref:DNA-binding response regulator, NarL/FixJ family, contains REC and HTH domains n=1 Tax=Pustulibacterium marinum TaxID=1224947 RepID=A0A1I7H5I2_9FLAO|nr:response regulator [Pustulibacterium marinum]SFU55940.1 DNA-binding response regulator, NarL/FixJ family, contains REC and HTH domains [Pustulibacterium marinum]